MRFLTGITTSGTPHLGNYVGSIRPSVRASQHADVLITHEAPSSHRSGAAILDDLARSMGARLIVHGHHHIGYRATAADGLQVQGVAAAWGVALSGHTHWQGDKPRLLPRTTGWTYR